MGIWLPTDGVLIAGKMGGMYSSMTSGAALATVLLIPSCYRSCLPQLYFIFCFFVFGEYRQLGLFIMYNYFSYLMFYGSPLLSLYQDMFVQTLNYAHSS